MNKNRRNQEKRRKAYEGETLLPFGLSVECIKRAHSIQAHFSDLGFPWETECEVEKAILTNPGEPAGFVLEGDLTVTC